MSEEQNIRHVKLVSVVVDEYKELTGIKELPSHRIKVVTRDQISGRSGQLETDSRPYNISIAKDVVEDFFGQISETTLSILEVVFHEMTHMMDIEQMGELNNEDYFELLGFVNWTEYNARRQRHKLFLMHHFGDNYGKTD